jgi:NAD-dependent deacetylase
MNRILIFAGAGISAESGLATFRETGGLWTQFDVDDVCNYRVFKAAKEDEAKRAHIFDFYNKVKEAILQAEPNEAHKQVARWQQTYGKERVKIVTANIDNLFEKAGCEDVVHVHGEIFNMHCAACAHTWNIGDAVYDHKPRCPKCTSRLTKPNVVFFGEMAPEYMTMHQIFNLKHRHAKDIILYVGSSMSVIHPSRLIENRHHPRSGITILVNKDHNDDDNWFRHKFYGLATQAMPAIDKNLVIPNMLPEVQL